MSKYQLTPDTPTESGFYWAQNKAGFVDFLDVSISGLGASARVFGETPDTFHELTEYDMYLGPVDEPDPEGAYNQDAAAFVALLDSGYQFAISKFHDGYRVSVKVPGKQIEAVGDYVGDAIENALEAAKETT